jgi:hypothetical protein
VHQFVEIGKHRIHFGALHGFDHDGDGIFGPVCPLGGCSKLVVVVGRHQHEVAASIPRNFDWSGLRFAHRFTELASECHRVCLSHDRPSNMTSIIGPSRRP